MLLDGSSPTSRGEGKPFHSSRLTRRFAAFACGSFPCSHARALWYLLSDMTSIWLTYLAYACFHVLVNALLLHRALALSCVSCARNIDLHVAQSVSQWAHCAVWFHRRLSDDFGFSLLTLPLRHCQTTPTFEYQGHPTGTTLLYYCRPKDTLASPRDPGRSNLTPLVFMSVHGHGSSKTYDTNFFPSHTWGCCL